ncbi:MAG TPA: tetratricopeptide repeat protein [Elusimicrobiota bacterium]|nr:tetratricopeptide repeat protein [Elusimicrobiota bacterium]
MSEKLSERRLIFRLLYRPDSPVLLGLLLAAALAADTFLHAVGRPDPRPAPHADITALWERTLRIAPQSALAHINLGRTFLDRGDPDRARRHFESAVAIDPHDATHWMLLGFARYGMNDPDGAVRAFQEALRVDPGMAMVHYNWGLLLERQGRTAEAMDHFRRAETLDPSILEFSLLIAERSVRQKQFREAVARYENVRQKKPEQLGAHDYLHWGLALGALGADAEARPLLQRALALRPTLPDELNRTGVTLANQGNWTEAAACFEKALALRPDHPDALAHRRRALKKIPKP